MLAISMTSLPVVVRPMAMRPVDECELTFKRSMCFTRLVQWKAFEDLKFDLYHQELVV